MRAKSTTYNIQGHRMVIQNAKQGGKRYQRDIQTQIQVANKLTTPWKNEIWFKR